MRFCGGVHQGSGSNRGLKACRHVGSSGMASFHAEFSTALPLPSKHVSRRRKAVKKGKKYSKNSGAKNGGQVWIRMTFDHCSLLIVELLVFSFRNL